jgi:choline kinase
MMITIVKLAAGVGSRLLPLTATRPKILVDVGGRTLLESQVEAIAACGVRRVRIVTGHRAEQVEASVRGISGVDFDLVYNPHYRESDNIVSAWIGLQDLGGRVVLVNGDNLYRPSVLRGTLERRGHIVMAISRKPRYDADDMKVITRRGRVVDVGKQLPAGAADGESIGMVSFSPAGIARFRAVLHQMVVAEGMRGAYYLAALRRLMQEGEPIRAAECHPDDWAEIDCPADLAQVRSRGLFAAHL